MENIRKYDLPVDYTTLNWRNGDNRLVRRQYEELQNGKCYFCNCYLDADPSDKVKNADINWSLFPRGFQNNPVHLQHSHKTNMTEGAVHMRCNAYMWQYEGR